jgi:hypothetical protein
MHAKWPVGGLKIVEFKTSFCAPPRRLSPDATEAANIVTARLARHAGVR